MPTTKITQGAMGEKWNPAVHLWDVVYFVLPYHLKPHQKSCLWQHWSRAWCLAQNISLEKLQLCVKPLYNSNSFSIYWGNEKVFVVGPQIRCPSPSQWSEAFEKTCFKTQPSPKMSCPQLLYNVKFHIKMDVKGYGANVDRFGHFIYHRKALYILMLKILE